MVDARNLTEELRFHGRYGSETQQECAERKNIDRERAADRLEALERQIVELRAERDAAVEREREKSQMLAIETHHAEAAEAENARLRALPLKDEVERVLRETDCTSPDGTFVHAPTRQVADALSRLRAGEQGGHWREIETNFQIKGRRRSPAYFPATGEVCEVSGPNCDDANGYTWATTTVLWQSDIFVLYGQPGFWPVLHRHEHVLFRPLSAKEGRNG